MDGPRRPPGRPLGVAVLHWGNVVEDYLRPLGADLRSFREEMTGGWLFGYVAALQAVGDRPAVVCVSEAVRRPVLTVHEPTGAPLAVLPATRPLRVLRRLAQPLDRLRSRSDRLRRALTVAEDYLATPPVRLRRALRRLGADVLVVQEYESPRFDVAVLLRRFLRVRVVGTYQGARPTRPGVERLVRPRTVAAAHGLVVASATELARVQRAYRLPPGRLARVFNPLDPPPPLDRQQARVELGLPADAFVVAWHGRVERRRKGLDVLLDAWAELREARPHAELRLLLLGTGSDAGWLRRRIAEVDPAGIRWHDAFVHDRSIVNRHLSAADAYAFPSPHEGFAVAPVEAMAAGLAVVGADAPGVADLFEPPGETAGTVVPVGDASALARALARLADDPDLARAMGRAGQARVAAAFSPRAVGCALHDFLAGDRG